MPGENENTNLNNTNEQGGAQNQNTELTQAQQAQIDSIINKLNTPADSDTQNLDVLLQDPKIQAEFDKKVEKAINKAIKAKDQEYQKQTAALQASLASEKDKMRENILEEIEQKKKEAEEMAKMTMEERYKKQIDQQELKIA